MSLYSQDLSLHALGIQQDSPGPGQEFPLKPGIHLRWLFSNERGFPWHGYYLFRRPHLDRAHHLFRIKPTELEQLLQQTTTTITLTDPHNRARLTTDNAIPVRDLLTSLGTAPNDRVQSGAFQGEATEQFALRRVAPADDVVGVDLNAGNVVIYPGKMLLRISLRVAFAQDNTTVTVEGLRRGNLVWRESISGGTGTIDTRDCRYDHAPVDEIRFSRADAYLINVVRALILTELGSNTWQALNTAEPIRLPILHPDYPLAPNSESPPAVRQATTSRQIDTMSSYLSRRPVDDIPVSGTVQLTPQSFAVRGNWTNWDNRLVGAVLQFNGRDVPYVVWRVVQDDLLVLSRPYEGHQPEHNASYTANNDPFGQFYDSLLKLVEGGEQGLPMHQRTYAPRTIPNDTLKAQQGHDTLTGVNTNWTTALQNMQVRILHHSEGAVGFQKGLPVLYGENTQWTSAVIGRRLVIDGIAQSFTVRALLTPALLIVDAPLEAPSAEGLTYRIVEPETYAVKEVLSPSLMRIDRPYERRTIHNATYLLEGGRDELADVRPLEILQMASLRPGIAQGLGLYWLDRPGEDRAYDYLIVADHGNHFHHDPMQAQRWVNSQTGMDWVRGLHDEPGLNGAMVLEKRVENEPKPAAPDGVRAYRVPETARLYPLETPANAMRHASVALTWGTNEVVQPLPHFPIRHHVWRTPLREMMEGNSAPPRVDYQQITFDANGEPAAVIPAQPTTQRRHTDIHRPQEYPSDPVYYTDHPTGTGWHSYRVNSLDLFGRSGDLSEAAAWHETGSFTAGPPPQMRHPFAVHIEDTTPPPPPIGVQAAVLDADDPYVLRDTVHQQWRAAHPDVIGLRVRWLWTSDQIHQAPDTATFRIAFHPRRMNVLTGTIQAVQKIGDNLFLVDTGISQSEARFRYNGLAVRSAGRSYYIQDGTQADPLVVHVRGAQGEPPSVGEPCAIAIPPSLRGVYTDYSGSDAWDRPVIREVTAASHTGQQINPIRHEDGSQLGGDFARIEGREVLIQDASELDAVSPMRDYVQLAGDPQFHRIVAVKDGPLRLVLASVPAVTGTVGWQIGQVIQHYEVLLPDDHPFDLQLTPTNDEPVAYGFVGVMAVDAHNNESRVSAPVQVQRVLRQTVDEPELLVSDSDRLWATPADYYGQSTFTVHWRPRPGYRAHIYRALDASLLMHEERLRNEREPLQSNDAVFPAGWSEAKCELIAQQINALSGPEDYTNLWNDALRILASLPGAEAAFTQLTTKGVSADSYLDQFDGLARNRYLYRVAFVDAAGNTSPLSLATPPVYLPDVILPQPPTVTRITIDDAQVSLTWAATRQPVRAYRVFRTTKEEHARDIRNMVWLDEIEVNGQRELTWLDGDVVGGRTYYYRLTAQGENGVMSRPTDAITVHAVDRRPPVPPYRQEADWVLLDANGSPQPWTSPPPAGQTPAVYLRWEHDLPDISFIVMRRPLNGAAWEAISPSISRDDTRYTAVDDTADSLESYAYRVKVLSVAGTASIYHRELQIVSPHTS